MQQIDHVPPVHPYSELIGMKMDGYFHHACECSIEIVPSLHNPLGVAHGAVLYGLADTGMGGALMPALDKGQLCATIEIKFNYYKAVREGTVKCISKVLNRGKRVANMESKLYLDDELVASANGSFAIFTPGQST
jgi:acyl-CoA thioesterase